MVFELNLIAVSWCRRIALSTWSGCIVLHSAFPLYYMGTLNGPKLWSQLKIEYFISMKWFRAEFNS